MCVFIIITKQPLRTCLFSRLVERGRTLGKKLECVAFRNCGENAQSNKC